MKNFKKGFKWTLITGCSLGLACAIAFFLAIGCGAFDSMRSVWVGSAMTTYNHKYLATWFVPSGTIDNIMEGSKQDNIEIESHKTYKPTDPSSSSDPTNSNTDGNEKEKYAKQGYEELSEGVYLKKIEGTNATGKYVGYIMMTVDPLRVKLSDTPKQFGVGRQVSQMLGESGGLYAINGGGFVDGEDYNGNGGWPYGVLVENGEVVLGNFARMVCMDKEGSLIVKTGDGNWARQNNIWSACTTDYILIVDGDGMIKSGDGGWGTGPRSAIGQRETGEVLFLVIDGRQIGYSLGGTMRDLQDVLLEEGCVNAAALDGGSSSVLEKLKRDEKGELVFIEAQYSNTLHPDVEFLNHPFLGYEKDDDHVAYVNAQRYINNAWIVMPVGYKPGDEEKYAEHLESK